MRFATDIDEYETTRSPGCPLRPEARQPGGNIVR